MAAGWNPSSMPGCACDGADVGRGTPQTVRQVGHGERVDQEAQLSTTTRNVAAASRAQKAAAFANVRACVTLLESLVINTSSRKPIQEPALFVICGPGKTPRPAATSTLAAVSHS